MRALVRRPIGLGNYVPEGACFQAEGKKACTLFQAATRVGGDLYAVVAVECGCLDGPRFEARAGYQPALVAFLVVGPNRGGARRSSWSLSRRYS